MATLPDDEKAALDGRVMGAFIRATKPKVAPTAEVSGACCGPTCCQKQASAL